MRGRCSSRRCRRAPAGSCRAFRPPPRCSSSSRRGRSHCQGWLIDRMGPRLFISIAGVLCGIGWGGHGLRHQPADAVHAVRAGRHRRGARLRRLDRIGAQVVHHERAGWRPASWPPASAAARRCSSRSSPSMLQSDGYPRDVSLDRRLSRSGHPDRRAVPAASSQAIAASGAGGRRRQPPRLGARSTSRPARWCARRSSRMMYVAFVLMATGGLLLTLNAGPIAALVGYRRGRAGAWPHRSTPWPTAPAGCSGAGCRIKRDARPP